MAKETNETETITNENAKNDAISNLYTIRAGMSSISLAKKQIEDCDSAKEILRKNLEETNEKYKKEYDHYFSVTNKQDMYSKKNKHISFVNALGEVVATGVVIFLLLLGVGALWFVSWGIVSFLADILKIINQSVLTFWQTTLINYILIGGGILFSILSIACIIWEEIETNSKYKNERTEAYREDASRISREVQFLQGDIENITIKYNECQKIKDKEKVLILNTAKGIYNALKSRFEKFLNPVDWCNIDLLIYYIATGRADTVKEALNLVDRQKQTDSIINEVKSAASGIKNEIRSNFATLGNVINENFKVLNNQLASQHKEIMGSLNDMSGTLKDMTSSLKEVTSSLTDIKEQNKELIDINSKQVEALYDFSRSAQATSNMSSIDLATNLQYMMNDLSIQISNLN